MHPQKKWRLATGHSQGDLSRASVVAGMPKVDQGLISKIEQEGSFPGIRTAAQLCIASAKLSDDIPPLRLAQYLPHDLMLTYSQTMEAHQHGMAEGGIAKGVCETGGVKAKKAAAKAVKSTDKRKRPRGGASRGRKAAKTAAAHRR